MTMDCRQALGETLYQNSNLTLTETTPRLKIHSVRSFGQVPLATSALSSVGYGAGARMVRISMVISCHRMSLLCDTKVMLMNKMLINVCV